MYDVGDRSGRVLPPLRHARRWHPLVVLAPQDVVSPPREGLSNSSPCNSVQRFPKAVESYICSHNRTPLHSHPLQAFESAVRRTLYTLHTPRAQAGASECELLGADARHQLRKIGDTLPRVAPTTHNLASVTPVASVSPNFGDDHHDSEWFQRPTSWLRSAVRAIKRMRQELWPVHNCPRISVSPPPQRGGGCAGPPS
mgnify:CR=1 FL=1